MTASSRPEPHAIDRPVFVIGTGRSGLTPLMDLIAYHPAFAWPSQYNHRFPGRRSVSLLSRVVDLPGVRSGLKFRLRPYMPIHDESYAFWDHLFHGFGLPFRDLLASDVTPWVRDGMRRAVAEIVRYQGKTRFIAEYSGWSRVDFLKAVFPDARFVHIVRDGRAVANSLTHVAWWRGWEGVYRWHLGVPEPELLEKLEKYQHSFLALAGIYWKILVRNLVEKTTALPAEDFRLVRYEDLVKDPIATARECIAFVGLDPDSPRFRAHLSTVAIVDANAKKMRIPSWRRNMSDEQAAMLDDLLGEELALFQYL
jgi:hypothetical protein